MDFILYIFQTILLSSLVIVMIWLSDRAIGKRTGYRWRKILWFVLAIRLLFPVKINLSEFTDSFHGLEVTVNVPGQFTAIPAEDTEPTDESAHWLTEVESANAMQNERHILPRAEDTIMAEQIVPKQIMTKYISISDMIVMLWGVGTLTVLMLRICQYRRMRKECYDKSAAYEEAEITELEQRICRELGIKNPVPIRIMDQDDHHKSPMLFGYLKPALLIPDVSYTTYELDAILKHELLHYRAKDLWYKLLMVIVCDIYWFNPVFRLMKNMAFRDVECVCDEKATQNMDLDAKKDYSNTILKTMSGMRENHFAFTTQFVDTKKSIKERLNNIFSTHNRKAGIGIFCVILLILAVGTVCVSLTSSENMEEEAAPETETTRPEQDTVDRKETVNQQENEKRQNTPQETQEEPQEKKEGTRSISIDSGILDSVVLTEGYDGILSALKEQYSDYNVTLTEEAFNYYNEASFDQIPTVFQVPQVGTLALAQAGKTADITDILEERGWLEQMDGALKATVSDGNGRVYGIPQSHYAYGLTVNVKLFQEAGLVDEEGIPLFPRTWEELAEAAVKIKDATGAAGICLIAKDYYGSTQFLNMAWNFGATDIMSIGEDGSCKTHLDSDAAIEAMEFVKDLKWKYNVLTEEPAKENYITGYEHLANGTAAMFMGANDSISVPIGYGMNPEDIALGAMPAGPGGKQYSLYGNEIYVFSADAAPEEIDAALSLLEMLGMGPVPNDAAKNRIQSKIQSVVSQGGPVIREIPVWKNEELLEYEQNMIAEMGNTNQALYQSYFDNILTPGNMKSEEYFANSELAAELSAVLNTVITDENADVEKMMKKANENWQKSVDIYLNGAELSRCALDAKTDNFPYDYDGTVQ